MVEETDINFMRAMRLLEQRFEGPSNLITYWRAIGNLGNLDYPMPEIVKPWWNGMEDLVFGVK